jgi:hypothetical protein
MGGIKPNAGYPVMTVSKFLHFYNPALFPIYDTEVVENRVLKRFRGEFRAFCVDAGVPNDTGESAAFLRSYGCWGSSLVAGAHSAFMDRFLAWLDW